MNKVLDFEKARFVATHVIVTSEENTTTANTVPLAIYPPEDPSHKQALHLVEQSRVLDFWGRPEEDGYTESDGEPI